MQILRVAQKVYPEVKGGGPYHVHALSRDQAATGHDVTVLTVGEQPRRKERDGYTVITCESWGSILGNDLAPGIWQYLRRATEYDVVHAHSHLYLSTNLAALRRRLGGTPLAITNHGVYSQNAPERLFDVYLRTVGRWTLNSADVVFCYTERDQERLRDFGVTTAIEVVHNGINTDQFTPEGPEHDGIIGNPAVLFVGRLVDGKRPGDALDVFTQLREQFPNAGLTVCGEGPLQEDLEARSRAVGLVDAVQFLGHISYKEMPSVYRAADALVLPSRAEGLPRTVLEAMACDVPVVVTDLEQIAAVVTEGGEIAPVGDIEGLSAALARVITERDKYHPRKTVESSFDWADTVAQTTTVLRRLR